MVVYDRLVLGRRGLSLPGNNHPNCHDPIRPITSRHQGCMSPAFSHILLSDLVRLLVGLVDIAFAKISHGSLEI